MHLSLPQLPVSLSLFLALGAPTSALSAAPRLAGVELAIQSAIDAHEISGAVTAVVTKDKLLDLEAIGFADLASQKPMRPDSLFWIKSMTKPVTAVAVVMLQDQGKLDIADPVAKYLPAFAGLRTPSGAPANLTLSHLLTHTSGLSEGLGESGGPGADRAHTLADLIPQYLSKPMLFEPGTQWKYCQSGINTLSRIVEVVSGVSFDQFCTRQIFAPLGMVDTTFYPTEAQQPRIATIYNKSRDGTLEPAVPRTDLLSHDRPPLGNSGLYSTAPDYARFCQMLLNGGELSGHRLLKPATVKLLATPRTGALKAGFVPGSAWALACGVVTEPQGVTDALSPGTFGHGGAFGTQAWIDPVKGVAYILMIQREKFGTPGYRNGDDTKVRADFQQAAASALGQGR